MNALHDDARIAIVRSPLIRGSPLRRRIGHAISHSLLRGLGAVLLTASLMKFWAVSRYSVLASSSVLESHAVVWTGIDLGGIVGVLLVSGLWPQPMWWFAVLLFSGFAMVAGIEAVAGKASCGCFGMMSVRPVYTLLFDVAAVMGLLTMKKSVSLDKPQAATKIAAVVVILAWAGIAAGFWITRPAMASDIRSASGQELGKIGELVLLEPTKWGGERFTLAAHIDVGERLINGRWIVLLVHHDCDHCAAAVRQYIEAWGSVQSQAAQLAVVEMPPFADGGTPSPWPFPQAVLSGSLDQSRDWFASTPVAVLVEDGIVISGKDGESAETPDMGWFQKAAAPHSK